MNINRKTFEQYIRENQTGGEHLESVLQLLVTGYLEDHPISSEQIKRLEKELEPYLDGEPVWRADILFRSIYDLCGAYQEAALIAGLRMGIRLAMELGEE